MNTFFKKVFFSIVLTLAIISCESDDNSTASNNAENERERVIIPNTSGPIIDTNGSINLASLRRVNPNFNLANLNDLGSSARDLVRDNQFKSITLEIVSVEGFEPSEFAKQNLIQFISDRLNKPDGVTIVEQTIPAPDVEEYTVQSIFEQVEAPNRTQFNTEDNLAIFIFFADRDNAATEFSNRSSTVILGTAYLNTSFVIYESTLIRFTRNIPRILERVEAGTLNHEFCHLLGLVNSEFTPQQEAHESQIENEDGELEGNGHCNVPFCLMEASARLVTDMMNNVNVLQLDPLCIQDLRAIGGK